MPEHGESSAAQASEVERLSPDEPDPAAIRPGVTLTEWFFEPDTFVPLARREGEQLFYVVCDHLGTPRELFSEDGQCIWAAEYTTWGELRRIWQADNDNFTPDGNFQGYGPDGKPV